MDRLIDRVAQCLGWFLSPVARYINYVATSLILVMVFFIVTDVTSRFLFNKPLMGTLEYVRFMLVLVIFWGLAYTQLKKRHVRIDLIMAKAPPAVGMVVDGTTYALSAVVVAIMTWQTAAYAIETFHTKYLPQGIHIPIWPVVSLATVGVGLLCIALFRDWLISLTTILKNIKNPLIWFSLSIIVALAGLASPIWLRALHIEVSSTTAGVIGAIIMLTLLMLRMHIGFAMGFIALVGTWYLRDLGPVLTVFKVVPYGTASTFLFTVLPFFILMGLLCYRAGISKDLYDTANAWVGHLPGGLAMASIGGCAGFSAICGDSLATAATMGAISIPEMKRFGYNSALATGSIAAGGTLGILIPPSVGFIIYGLLTEASISKLFIAGIFPGILLSGLFMLCIYVWCRINPRLGPRGHATTLVQKFKALKGTWAMLLLFVLVMGGIYAGAVTPTEGGALGAFGALIITLARRKLTWHGLNEALLETGQNTAMIMIILICVFMLGYFVSLSDIPKLISGIIISLEVSRYVVLLLVLFMYMVLGCVMNIVPMIMITLPIFYPTILALGFDPIWFGVIMVIMMEMGQITPPVGVNVYIIAGVAKDVPMGTIFKGIIPFWGMEIVCLVILTVFPQIALFLPGLM